jgi:hypothetical protein
MMCGRGGTGRRATLRSLWPKGRGSSSLLDRTKQSAWTGLIPPKEWPPVEREPFFAHVQRSIFRLAVRDPQISAPERQKQAQPQLGLLVTEVDIGAQHPSVALCSFQQNDRRGPLAPRADRALSEHMPAIRAALRDRRGRGRIAKSSSKVTGSRPILRRAAVGVRRRDFGAKSTKSTMPICL